MSVDIGNMIFGNFPKVKVVFGHNNMKNSYSPVWISKLNLENQTNLCDWISKIGKPTTCSFWNCISKYENWTNTWNWISKSEKQSSFWNWISKIKTQKSIRNLWNWILKIENQLHVTSEIESRNTKIELIPEIKSRKAKIKVASEIESRKSNTKIDP